MAQIALAYIPVLHEGYHLFLTANQPLARLYLLDQNSLKIALPELEYLRKDLRCLPVDLAKNAVASWQLAEQVSVVKNDADLPQLTDQDQVILTSDDIGAAVAEKYSDKYWPKSKLTFSPIFLRWDRDSVLKEKNIVPDGQVTTDELAQKYMSQAFATASHSSDWWRHVGGVLVDQNGAVLLSCANRHLPSDQTPYTLGDTRSLFKQGEFIELSTAGHAESTLIATAAKNGIKLAGCSLYVTDFPCPYCARVVAASGIKNLFFSRGYGVMDGEHVLKDSGVLIQRVILPGNAQKVADVSTYLKPY